MYMPPIYTHVNSVCRHLYDHHMSKTYLFLDIHKLKPFMHLANTTPSSNSKKVMQTNANSIVFIINLFINQKS